MRLRDLDLSVGGLQPGRRNAITDVRGVAAGHLDLRTPATASGLTAILPHPAGLGPQALFVGRWSVDGGEGLTGLGVAEDFGTISSPLVLAPAAAAGAVYHGLIRYGLDRDPGLSTSTGWPPLVVAIDESAGNAPAALRSGLDVEAVARVLAAAGAEVVEGTSGIGSALSSFGCPGGVGSASRVDLGPGNWTVGLLLAASGGDPGNLAVDGYPLRSHLQPLHPPSPPGTLAVVVATDAPLIPLQLQRLAGRCAIGLARVGILDAVTREGVAIAFSTVPAPDGDGGEREIVPEPDLEPLFQAAIEASQEAVLNALLAADPATTGALSVQDWPEAVRLSRSQ